MALAIWQRTIVDEAGDVQDGASVEVRRETGGSPLATLYSDRAGTVYEANPLTADANGFASFYVTGGAYRITATKGDYSQTWRYVAIGTAQEYDATTSTALVQNVDSGYALTFEAETAAPPSAGAIRFNNADLSAATVAYISDENLAGSDITNRLSELYSTDRTVKDTFMIQDPSDNTSASFQIDGVTDQGAYFEIDISNHSGSTTFTDDERINFQPNRAGADGAVSTDDALVENALVAGGSLTSSIKNYTGDELPPGSPPDLDELVETSIVSASVVDGVQNLPDDEDWMVFAMRRWEGSVVQIALCLSDGRMFIRSSLYYAWNSWVEMTAKATDAEIWAATEGAKAICAEDLESAAETQTLTDAATIALDWTDGINFEVTLTTDRILGNPTNAIPGTYRTVLVKSDGGPDTLTFGANYGGSTPILIDITTTKWYLLSIRCITTTHFIVTSVDGSAP